MKIQHSLLSFMAACALVSSCQSSKAPEAVLPVPEPKQVAWQQMETYAFVHFGLNTFNDREWGYGDSDPATFNPTRLDCEQWVRTFVQAGMKGVILTAKHHDGFCLWPTKLTEYCIRNTPYKDGKGDIVRELSDACRKYGIKFAVYLSPWDRHQANYGSPEYVDYFYAQLHELLSSYGEVFEVWFDGANGGDIWYGGAKETRTIDRKNYYNYPRAYAMIDSLQPQAVIFSDGGAGCGWVGNEKGYAGATNWSFLRSGEVFPGYPKYPELRYGHAGGDQWVAAECDVSIRPGWFYHPEEDDKVKSVEHLTDLYYRSVGHNATLLLNFPVDRRGLIHPTDSLHAVAMHQRVQQELAHNLLQQEDVKIEVSETRGKGFDEKALTDGLYDTYWVTSDGVKQATVTCSFAAPIQANRLLLQEYIPLGQRVKTFVVEYLKGDTWYPVKCNEETTTVGYKRLLRFETVESNAFRFRFTDARAALCINEIGLYHAPHAKDVYINKLSDIESYPFSVVNLSSTELSLLNDRNPDTECMLQGSQFTIDLEKVCAVRSFHYLPSQADYAHGLVAGYELWIGETLDAMQKVAEGEFSNIKNNPILQSVYFPTRNIRYLTFKATRFADSADTQIGAAEIGVHF